MQTQLFFDLIAPDSIKVHFCEPEDIASVQPELTTKDIALFELDGAAIRSREQDSFLEYLDDVHEWVPAKGHIVVIQRSEQFWKFSSRLAGMLVEWWQFATGPGRKADIHLLFVW